MARPLTWAAKQQKQRHLSSDLHLYLSLSQRPLSLFVPGSEHGREERSGPNIYLSRVLSARERGPAPVVGINDEESMGCKTKISASLPSHFPCLFFMGRVCAKPWPYEIIKNSDGVRVSSRSRSLGTEAAKLREPSAASQWEHFVWATSPHPADFSAASHNLNTLSIQHQREAGRRLKKLK